MDNREPVLFALNASREFGGAVAAALGVPLGAHEEREFEDGEHKGRPLQSIRGRDVYVVQSLHGDATRSVDDKLARLLFFLGALRDAAAARVTAVVPYLAYARKDRRTKARDPVTTRYVAQLFEAVGTDCVVTLDVHNLAAFQNAFRCRTEHLEAAALFVRHLAARWGGEDLVVVSPDVGGLKRAEEFRRRLGDALGRPAGMAFVEKYRSAGEVSGEAFAGDVTGKTAIIVDDLISGGTTVARAAQACRARGARRVVAAVSHGAFAATAGETLAQSGLEALLVTDTVPPLRIVDPVARALLFQVSVAGLFAEAIRRLAGDGSIVELVEAR